MAKITTEYDSKTKAMKTFVDGKELKNIMSVSHYCTSHDSKGRPYNTGGSTTNATGDDDNNDATGSRKYCMSCTMADYDDAGKMTTHTHLMASESKEGQAAIASKQGKVIDIAPEFIVACSKEEIKGDK